ncbi:MAG: tetratricopeptide repeat protein [Verrucomicrobiota bacterium]
MRKKVITLAILAVLFGGVVATAFFTPYYWVVAIVAIVAVLAFRNELPRGHAWVIALVLLTAVVFGRTVNHQFIIWDDDKNIYENPAIIDPSFDYLGDFWKTPVQGLYIPVTYNVWGLLSMVSGKEMNPEASAKEIVSPKLYHLANLTIHTGSVLLLILIIYQLLGRRDLIAAVAGAAFFAIHPLQVEPVSWATGMKDVLSTFLGLLCFYFYIKHSRSWRGEQPEKAVTYYFGAALIYIVALLAKPSVVVIPPMLFIIDVFILNAKWKPEIFRFKWQPTLLGAFGAVNIVAWALVFFLGRGSQDSPGNAIYLAIAISIGLVTLVTLAIQWKNPVLGVSAVAIVNIGIWYEIFYENYHQAPSPAFSAIGASFLFSPFDTSHIALVWVATAGIVTIASFVAIYVFWPSIASSAVTRIIPFFAIAIFFVLQTRISQSEPDAIFPFEAPNLFGRIIVALDALGFYISKFFYPIGLGTEYGRKPAVALTLNSQYPIFLVPILLGILILLIRKQRNYYLVAFSIALFAVAPVLGIIKFAFQGQSTVADRYVYVSMVGISLAVATWLTTSQKTAPRIFVGFAVVALATLSSIRAGHWVNSVVLYHQSEKINPKSVAVHYNIGLAYSHSGNREMAIEYYNRTIDLMPNFSRPFNNIGYILNTEQKYQEAIPYLEKAIEFQPDYHGSYSNLGIALDNLERHEEAIAAYKKAQELNPQAADIFVNLGVAYINLEEWDEALKAFQRAHQLSSTLPQAINGLARVYLQTGQYESAIQQFQKLLRLSTDLNAYSSLADAYERSGQVKEAVETLETLLQIARQTEGFPPNTLHQIETRLRLLRDKLNPTNSLPKTE